VSVHDSFGFREGTLGHKGHLENSADAKLDTSGIAGLNAEKEFHQNVEGI
jgi:hypothetical protein